MRNLRPLLLPLLGCTWLAAAAIACGGPAEPASSANDAPDAAVAEGTNGDPAPKWDSTSSAQPPPDGTTASPTGTATMGSMPEARRTDVYDKEATEVGLRRAAVQVKKNCGLAKNSDGKAVGPWGTTQVQVTLGHNGHVRGVTIPAPFDGAPSGKCAINAFSLLSFPPWAGDDITIPWDVEIVQPAK